MADRNSAWGVARTGLAIAAIVLQTLLSPLQLLGLQSAAAADLDGVIICSHDGTSTAALPNEDGSGTPPASHQGGAACPVCAAHAGGKVFDAPQRIVIAFVAGASHQMAQARNEDGPRETFRPLYSSRAPPQAD